MIIEGTELALNDYSVPRKEVLAQAQKNGWRIFQEYNSNIPEGTPTTGYRLFYKASDGKLYSPFHPNSEYIEKNLGTDNVVPQDTGKIHHDDTDRGYYYWVNRDIAETYMSALIVDQHLRNEIRVPGQLELHRVEGIAKQGVAGDEGDRMQDMWISPEPLISVKYSEFTK